MYAIEEVLRNADSRVLLVLLYGGIAFVSAYGIYIEGLRIGFRHRTHGIPVLANMYYFAHDIYFVSLYERWFVEIGHWMFKLFWVAMAVFALLEIAMHYQTIKYSLKSLFPSLERWQALVVYWAAQASIGVLFWFTSSVLADPLDLINLIFTLAVAAFMLPLRLHAWGDSRGQSKLLAGTILVSIVSFNFFLLPTLSDSFARFHYYTFTALQVALLLAYMWALDRTKSVTPAVQT